MYFDEHLMQYLEMYFGIFSSTTFFRLIIEYIFSPPKQPVFQCILMCICMFLEMYFIVFPSTIIFRIPVEYTFSLKKNLYSNVF